MFSSIFRRRSMLLTIVLVGLNLSTVSAQVMPKAQVGNLIAKVENGVDEFRKYLERRGDSAPTGAATPDAQSRRGRRRERAQKATAAERRTSWTMPSEI